MTLIASWALCVCHTNESMGLAKKWLLSIWQTHSSRVNSIFQCALETFYTSILTANQSLILIDNLLSKNHQVLGQTWSWDAYPRLMAQSAISLFGHCANKTKIRWHPISQPNIFYKNSSLKFSQLTVSWYEAEHLSAPNSMRVYSRPFLGVRCCSYLFIMVAFLSREIGWAISPDYGFQIR